MLLDITVHGDVQVSRRLMRFGDRAQDARPAFRGIADLLRTSEQRQFASRGRYASAGWAPLAPSTLASKIRRGESTSILEATGTLRDSLTRKTDGGHVELVEPHQLIFGSQVPYAKYHQRGTRTMPRRRPLEVRGRDRQEMVKIIQRHLMAEGRL